MFMPHANSYCYIVHAQCSLSSYPKWRMLQNKNVCALGTFIFEDIPCRWGAIEEIVTNNGLAFVQVAKYLLAHYKINHIWISPYNSQANRPVKHRHYNIWEALIKAAEGEENCWTTVVPSVFWAERVSIQKSTGYSPYYIAHNIEPLLPFDLTEATYLAPVLTKPIPTANLITQCTIQLQKWPHDLVCVKDIVLKVRYTSIHEFNKKFENTIHDFNFNPSTLVLVWNSWYDSNVGSKTKPHYFSPMIVLWRMTGGSYILSKLDGSISKLWFAAFHLVPYHPWDLQAIPVTKITDMNPKQLENIIYDINTLPATELRKEPGNTNKDAYEDEYSTFFWHPTHSSPFSKPPFELDSLLRHNSDQAEQGVQPPHSLLSLGLPLMTTLSTIATHSHFLNCQQPHLLSTSPSLNIPHSYALSPL